MPSDPGLAQGTDNADWLCQIVESQLSGRTCLPLELGLDPQQRLAVFEQYLSAELKVARQNPADSVVENSALRSELLQMREDEWEQLRDLLAREAAGREPLFEQVAARIIASGCLGGDHLWRDLGLASRADLRALLEQNFPALAQRNTQNMRWKKFFYKQLCEQDDAYVCRSPTCEQCPTYDDCFGDES